MYLDYAAVPRHNLISTFSPCEIVSACPNAKETVDMRNTIRSSDKMEDSSSIALSHARSC